MIALGVGAMVFGTSGEVRHVHPHALALDATLTGARQPASFEALPDHPHAATQPTDRGRRIGALHGWRGRLYSGYGDYGANTGPIHISPFDPSSGLFEDVLLSDTEAIENFRAIRGRLYAPAIDRRRKADYAVGEPWQDVSSLGTTHAFDVTTLDGADLWLVGSLGYQAAAWRSTDDGAHWQVARREQPASGIDGDFARFYFAGTLAGRLYLQATDYRGGPNPRSKVFDGSAWSDGPNLLLEHGTGWRPVEFAGRMVYQSWEQAGWLLAFDGKTVRQAVTWPVFDLDVAGPWLYALAGAFGAQGAHAGLVVRTADLATWSRLTTPPPEDSRSLAVLGDTVYLGGLDAHLYRLAGRPEWADENVTWNALPRARILRPSGASTLVAPATVPVIVSATDPDGTIAHVEVTAGETALTVDDVPPYLAMASDLLSGTVAITARAQDDFGAARRDAVTVRVADGANKPPTVETEPRILPSPARVGAIVTLTLTAKDPDGDPLSVAWLTGDGAVAYGQTAAHTYTARGRYQVVAIVTDGRGGALRRDLAIEVRPPVAPTATPGAQIWRLHLPQARNHSP